MTDTDEYYLLDVFTECAFAGNPLAIFPTEDGLGTGRMQAIANELNLSETVLREDPATGSAAAALVGTLAARLAGAGKWQWRIDQGVEMGRPSRILGEAERDNHHAITIRIAGQSIIVGQGAFRR